MDVGFGFIWQIVIHDQPDFFYIDAACCDVGSDEDGYFAPFEPCECAFTLGLGFVAMDCFGFVACGGECFCDFI